MPERQQGGSISRTLLLPREHHLDSGTLGTFRLRYILAEDGCKESQVALAKRLLSATSESSEERSFNAQLAVYWLLQAAKTGQDEAFLLLKECATYGLGISAISNCEVEKCLKFSEEEKISRRVASSIFRSIMSDTEEVIPEDIFREKIDVIFKEETGEKVLTKAGEGPPPQVCQKQTYEASLHDQAHVSFSEVVNSVQSCLEGNVPLVSLKQVTNYVEYKKWLPTNYIGMFWAIVLKSVENLIQNLSMLAFPLSALSMCLFLQIVTFLFPFENETSYFLKKAMLLSVVLLCFTNMISYTCFTIHINFGGDNVKKWLHLIKFFEPNIKPKEVERKYLSKTTFSLLNFFLMFIMFITLEPLNSLHFMFPQIGVLSFMLMLFVDRTIAHQRYYVNISLALNAITCLYKANMLQNFFTNSLTYFNFNLAYELVKDCYVNISFISCLALPFVLPYLYIKIALGQQRGWHLVLLPHLMSLTWMNLACSHLANSTTTDVILSVFTWLVILFLSHYIGIILTCVLYFMVKLVINIEYFRLEILLVFVIFIMFYAASLLFIKKFKASNESKLWPTVMCISVLILSYEAAKPPVEIIEDVSSNVIPWEKYQIHCHHPAWYRSNTAEVQISCLPLKGKVISMDGTVTGLDVIDVHNTMEIIANILPEPLRSWFVYIFGTRYMSCDNAILTQHEKERCKFFESVNINEFHLHNWDQYKYRIIMEISTRTSPEVILNANHACSSFIKHLKEGDSLQVTGLLELNIGSSSPQFALKRAKCTSCYTDASCHKSRSILAMDYRLSLKNIIFYFFSPFIQYEPK